MSVAESVKAGFLRDEFAAFLASRGLGGEAASAEFGRLLHLFIMMMQSRGGERRAGTAMFSKREERFRAFLASLFTDPVKSSPLFFITHGLAFLNYLPEQPFARPAVEIGCEGGYTSSFLFQEPFEQRVCVTASERTLSLADDSVAVVVLHNTIYRLCERDRILQEVYRVLRPGGRVLFNDISADICAMESHPTAQFMRQAGGRERAQRFMSARGNLSGGHTLNPLALITDERYPEYLARFGFHGARARYFCSPELTRMGYATHDVEHLFGLEDVEVTPWYRAWVENELLPLMLDDEAASRAGGGAFIFVVAEK